MNKLNRCACIEDCIGTITIPCCNAVNQIQTSGGAVVVYNDMTESSIANSGGEHPFFLAKNYLIPYDMLSSDGDEIRVRAEFTVKTSSSQNYVALKYDGVELIRYVVTNSDYDVDVEIESVISRRGGSLSADNIMISSKAAAAYKNPAFVQGQAMWQGKITQVLSKQYATVPGLTVEAVGSVTDPITAINFVKCKQLVVEYFPRS